MNNVIKHPSLQSILFLIRFCFFVCRRNDLPIEYDFTPETEKIVRSRFAKNIGRDHVLKTIELAERKFIEKDSRIRYLSVECEKERSASIALRQQQKEILDVKLAMERDFGNREAILHSSIQKLEQRVSILGSQLVLKELQSSSVHVPNSIPAAPTSTPTTTLTPLACQRKKTRGRKRISPDQLRSFYNRTKANQRRQRQKTAQQEKLSTEMASKIMDLVHKCNVFFDANSKLSI